MNESNQSKMTFGSFFKSEIKLVFHAFWHPLWWTTFIVGLLLLLYCVVRSDKAPDVSYFDYVLSLVIFCFAGGFLLGSIVGLVNMAWRMAGFWIVFPLIVVPLCISFSMSLFEASIASQMQTIQNTIVTLFAEQKWQDYFNVGAAGRVGVVVILLFVFILPLISIGFLKVIFAPVVLSLYTKLLLTVVFAILIGAIPSVVISFLVLLIAFARRLRRRFKALTLSACS